MKQPKFFKAILCFSMALISISIISQDSIHASDWWVLKLDSLGNKIWDKTYGGYLIDEATCIVQTDDEGYIIGGYSWSDDGDLEQNYGSADIWVIKIDKNGEIQWKKSKGGNSTDKIWSIARTNSNSYICTGYSWSKEGEIVIDNGGADYFTFEISDSGEVKWEKFYGGNAKDYSTTVIKCNSGYAIGGWTHSTDINCNNGVADSWILLIDSLGAVQDTFSFGGSDIEVLQDIIYTSDNNILQVGGTKSNDIITTCANGDRDAFIIKSDLQGNILWSKTYGGEQYDFARRVIEMDGGYLVAVYTFSDNELIHSVGYGDILLLKLDKNSGDVIWSKNFGGSSDDKINEMMVTENGILICGRSHSEDHNISNNNGEADLWVFELDFEGNVIWSKTYGGSSWDEAFNLIQTPDKNIMVVGFSQSTPHYE